MAGRSREFIGSLAKGLRVIETFGADHPRRSIAEVSGAADLDRATARRCLLTLRDLGYVDYDGKYFWPTARILRLGMGALAALPLPQIVQPWIDQLSERTGQSSSVALLDEAEIVYVARAAQKRVMSIGLMPGSRLPAHCTSLGRVLLAARPEADVRAVLEQADLTPRTPYSLTDADEVLARIALARQDGYAVIDQEVELGLRSIAVPLRNARGQVVAALNVGVAAVQQDPNDLVALYLPELLRTQAGLARLVP